MPDRIDLTGKRVDRLVVIAYKETRKGRRFWLCACDCGKSTVVSTKALTTGNTRSCGCFTRDRVTTHGLSRTPEYAAWKNMKGRCFCPTDAAFDRYGGRGITVCDEWKTSFTAFLRDMGPRPGPEYTIERKNNDLGYSKENCEWATVKTQDRNKRNNRVLTFDGRTQCMAAWAEECGMDRETFGNRIRHGWSVERALNTPVRVRRSR